MSKHKPIEELLSDLESELEGYRQEIETLRAELKDAENDRKLIKAIIRKFVDMIATEEGRQHRALKAIRNMLKGEGGEDA